MQTLHLTHIFHSRKEQWWPTGQLATCTRRKTVYTIPHHKMCTRVRVIAVCKQKRESVMAAAATATSPPPTKNYIYTHIHNSDVASLCAEQAWHTGTGCGRWCSRAEPAASKQRTRDSHTYTDIHTHRHKTRRVRGTESRLPCQLTQPELRRRIGALAK